MNAKAKLISHIESNGLVCPNPQKWELIFKIIRDELPQNKLTPLILASWHHTEDSEKQCRLIEQIEFAFSLKNGKAEQFEKAIYALDDADWYKGY